MQSICHCCKAHSIHMVTRQVPTVNIIETPFPCDEKSWVLFCIEYTWHGLRQQHHNFSLSRVLERLEATQQQAAKRPCSALDTTASLWRQAGGGREERDSQESTELRYGRTTRTFGRIMNEPLEQFLSSPLGRC